MASLSPLPSNREVLQPDRRKHERHIVLRVATLKALGRSQQVLIVDISAGGLKLRDAFGLRPEDRVQLEFEDGRCIEGAVVWTLPHRCGIAFDKALGEDDPLLSGH